MRWLALVALLSGCAAPSPPSIEVLSIDPDLRHCEHPARAPKPLPPVVGTEALRIAYDAEHAARQQDQLAAVDCGRALAQVVLLIDAFNTVHAKH